MTFTLNNPKLTTLDISLSAPEGLNSTIFIHKNLEYFNFQATHYLSYRNKMSANLQIIIESCENLKYFQLHFYGDWKHGSISFDANKLLSCKFLELFHINTQFDGAHLIEFSSTLRKPRFFLFNVRAASTPIGPSPASSSNKVLRRKCICKSLSSSQYE